MASFKDSGGNEWQIYLDAFLLRDIQKETGVDLADVSAGGWMQVETDSGALGRVLAIICREEIKSRRMTAEQFAKGIRGRVIETGREALRTEAADFFPPSEWSAIRSNSTKRTKAKQDAEEIRAAMEAMEGMGPDFRAGAMQALQEAMKESATEGLFSGLSTGKPSVSGPAAIPSTNAIDGPESAESPPED